MWEEIACPLCGDHNYHVRYRGSLQDDESAAAFACTNVFWNRYRQVVTCTGCGMLYNNPCETAATLLANYQDVVDHTYLREIAARQRTFHATVRRLRRLQPPPGRLLDVGCYTGHFAAIARDAGYEVAGIELSRWAAAHARRELGITIVAATLPEAASGSLEPFDIITMWDVIEHIADPQATIASAAAMLKPGGILALSTHNMDSWAARLLQRRYPFLMQMHVAHFTPRSLRRLFSAHGLAITMIRPHWRWIRVGYALEKLKSYAPPLYRLFGSAARLVEDWLLPVTGLGLMDVYAVKEGTPNA